MADQQPARTFSFEWTSSYQGEVDYKVRSSDGLVTGTLALRRGFREDDRRNYNGSDIEFRRDIVQAVGLLRWSSDPTRPVTRDVVQAFNEWARLKHEQHVEQLREIARRYADVTTEEEQLRYVVAPLPVDGGVYSMAYGWRRIDAAPVGTPIVPFTDRTPIPDDRDAEVLRRHRYWTWLDENAAAIHERRKIYQNQAMEREPGAGSWMRVANAMDADFVAFHERHSIGYSFDHYAQMGNMFCLLSQTTGLPLATILVSPDGRVIHAREAGNARLSPRHRQAVENLAQRRGWKVVPDTLSFDADIGEGNRAPNTRITYIARDPKLNVRFRDTVVLDGRLTGAEIIGMDSALWRTGGFPTPKGFLRLGDRHVLVSVEPSWEDPTPGLEDYTAKDFARHLRLSPLVAGLDAGEVKMADYADVAGAVEIGQDRPGATVGEIVGEALTGQGIDFVDESHHLRRIMDPTPDSDTDDEEGPSP